MITLRPSLGTPATQHGQGDMDGGPDLAPAAVAPALDTDGAGRLIRPWCGRRAGAKRATVAARAAATAERRRLARELHDSISQTLIGLQLTARAAADLWDTQPELARAALDTLCSLATGATTEMRAVLLDLHDAVLERQGLVAALEAYCALVRERSGLRVELHLQEVGPATGVGPHRRGERLPAAQEEALYSLVREALTNVIKHARATRATVTLALDARPCVCVEDDGVGFGAPPAAFSYGLVGMRERVGALGGRLRLDNGPAGGARVTAELPAGTQERRPPRPALAHGPAAEHPPAPWSSQEARG